MESFEEYLHKNSGLREASWLILGKGPSFSPELVAASDLVKVGINHVYRSVNVDFLHVFDLDVLDSFDDEAFGRFKYLVMPWIPNISYKIPGLQGTFHKPAKQCMEELVQAHPVLRVIDKQHRLLCYFPAGTRVGDSEGVRIGSFSASTIVSLLGLHGIKKIRLNGVDGGSSYAADFSSLQHVTLLSAGQGSFDVQFREIAALRNELNLEILPLANPAPIRIYVGAQPEQELAYQVLKYSIEINSSLSVQVCNLASEIEKNIPDYRDQIEGIRQGTPFSLQRFAIPELCGFKGRALYLDSDMLVFRDIRELWVMPMTDFELMGAAVLPEWNMKSQLSVLLFNCERSDINRLELVAKLRERKIAYEAIFERAESLGSFGRLLSPHWNSLEHYQAGATGLLHYTNMNSQPWLSVHNPLAFLWCETLYRAVIRGAISLDLVVEHAARGWIRPSLIWQMQEGINDPYLIPRNILREDQNFVPPHGAPRSKTLQRISGFGADVPSTPQIIVRVAYARIRYFIIHSSLHRYIQSFRCVIRKIAKALSTGIGC